MPITVVTAGVSARQVRVYLSPLAELGALLHGIVRADHHPRATTAVRQLHADSHLLTLTRRFAPLYGAIRARFLLPLGVPDDTEGSLREEVAEIGRLPVRRFVTLCAVPISEQARDVDHDALLDDPDARDTFVKRVERISIARSEFARDLLDDPERVRGQLQRFLVTVGRELLEPEWHARSALLHEEAVRRRRELHLRGIGVLSSLSSMASWRSDPQRVVFDKVNTGTVVVRDQSVILVPSYHTSVHLIVKHDPGYPIVILYEASARPRKGITEVTRRIAALQDPMRVRLCRLILRQPRTTSDMSLSTGLTVPQVSRHLRTLREAGLVTCERRGKGVYYALDASAVRHLGEDVFVALLQ